MSRRVCQCVVVLSVIRRSVPSVRCPARLPGTIIHRSVRAITGPYDLIPDLAGAVAARSLERFLNYWGGGRRKPAQIETLSFIVSRLARMYATTRCRKMPQFTSAPPVAAYLLQDRARTIAIRRLRRGLVMMMMMTMMSRDEIQTDVTVTS